MQYPVGTKVITYDGDGSMELIITGWDNELGMYVLTDSYNYPHAMGFPSVCYVLRAVDFEVIGKVDDATNTRN